MQRIFLDNNSTTMLDDSVIDAMEQCHRMKLANPASQHAAGREARRVLEMSKEKLSHRFGLAEEDRFVLTSGGTESNNLGLFGRFNTEILTTFRPNIVLTSIEHPSILAAADELKRRGVDVRFVDPGISGSVDPAHFEDQIDEQTRLVCCMLGNNETGVIQPVSGIASICKRLRVPLHVDAVQGVGKQWVDFQQLGADSMSVSAHKIHGPVGVGALILKNTAQLNPIFFGGFQQEGVRPGTENVAGVVGFEVAMEKAITHLDDNCQTLSDLRDRLETGLLALYPDAQVTGFDQPRLPHCTNIAFPGVDRQQFLLAADTENVAVSTGSACSSGSSQPSHVLVAMGCPKEVIQSAIRFGVSIQNTPEQIDEAICRINRIFNKLRQAK